MCFLLFVVACDDSPQEHLSRAKSYIDAGNPDAAVIELKNALQKDRRNPEARLLLGETYLSQSRLRNAEKELRLAREYGADPERVTDALGATLLRRGESAAVLSEFVDSPDLPLAHRRKILILRAVALYSSEEFDAAKEEFQHVLQIDPDDLAALIGISSITLAQEDFENAQDFLSHALTIAPQNPKILRLMGNLRLHEGEIEEATRFFKDALAQNPTSLRGYLTLAHVQIAADQTAAAQESLNAVLERVPRHSGANYLKSVLAMEAGNHEAAFLHSSTVLKTKPRHPGSLLIAAAAGLALERPEQSYRFLSLFLADHPGHEVATRLLGSAVRMIEERDLPPSELKELLDGTAEHSASLLLADKSQQWENFLDAGASAWRELEGPLLKEDPAEFCKKISSWSAQPDAIEGPAPWIIGQLSEPCWSKARQSLQIWVEASRSMTTPRVLLAQIHLAEGQAAEAKPLIDDLLVFAPERSDYLLLAALSYLGTNSPAQAKAILRQIAGPIEKNPANHYLIAQSYVMAGEHDKAAHLLTQLLPLGEPHDRTRLALAGIALANREFGKASDLLAEIIRSAPQHVDALEMMGDLHSLQGDGGEAQGYYEKVMRIEPTSARALKLAHGQVRAGNDEEAVATLRSWLAEHPEDVDVRTALGNQLLAQQNFFEASLQYRKILILDPLNIVALNNGAWSLFRMNDLPGAWSLAQRALEAAPDNKDVLDTAAQILMGQGDFDTAAKVLERASQRAPLDPSIQYRYGRTLAALERSDEATAVLGAALATTRPFPERSAAEALYRELMN